MSLDKAELSMLMDCADGVLSQIDLGVIPGYLDDDSAVVIAPLHAQLLVDHYASLTDDELSRVESIDQLFTHLVDANRDIRRD